MDEAHGVVAKCQCTKVEDGEVVLHPVTGGSDENDRFFDATPGGVLRLSIVRSDVLDRFTVGGEYYVTFSPA